MYRKDAQRYLQLHELFVASECKIVDIDPKRGTVELETPTSAKRWMTYYEAAKLIEAHSSFGVSDEQKDSARNRIDALKDSFLGHTLSMHAVRANQEAGRFRSVLSGAQLRDLTYIMYGWVRGLLIDREVYELCEAIDIEQPAELLQL